MKSEFPFICSFAAWLVYGSNVRFWSPARVLEPPLNCIANLGPAAEVMAGGPVGPVKPMFPVGPVRPRIPVGPIAPTGPAPPRYCVDALHNDLVADMIYIYNFR